ncbi:hypothetical protein [Oceanobacillus sp. FSL H7-0719]|uniref:hypothetical protein n=1 Tax=Oceanobacillus sp. FSL H7-0719 TaxID=2954507 RepID=UPI00324504D8
MISKMSLLAGEPIDVGKFKVKPWTLREIVKFGNDKYSIFASHLLITVDKLRENDNINKDVLNGLNDYQALCMILLGDEIGREIFLEGLGKTLGYEFRLSETYGIYYVNEEEVYEPFDPDSLELIQKVFNMQNYFSDGSKENEFKPANELARKLYEQRMKARKKVQESKGKDGEGHQMENIISIVGSYSEGVNLNTIWGYTVYQLYEEYIRLIIWDDFQYNRNMLPHMDEETRNNLKLKHWGTKVSPQTLKEE